jgi:hypothetical protein
MSSPTLHKLSQQIADVATRRKTILGHIYQLESESKRLSRSVDHNVGEVRLDAQGNPTLYLNNTGMRMVKNAIKPGDTEGFLKGMDMNLDEARWIKERISTTRPADGDEELVGKPLMRLFDAAIANASNAGITLVGKTGKGIQSAIGTLREELLHRWQRSRSAQGLPQNHLSSNAFLNLFTAMPDAAYDHLKAQGYDDTGKFGKQSFVIEATAKIMAGKWRKIGLTKPEAARYLGQYFAAVTDEHGIQAVLEIEHTYGMAREFQKEVEKLYGPGAATTAARPAEAGATVRKDSDANRPLPRMESGRSEEVGGDAAGRAGGIEPTEAPEAQRRPIKTFVSPNVFNLDSLKDAQKRLGSMPHKLMKQESDWLLGELGSKVKSRSATGIWEDGAEDTLIHEFPSNTDPDLVTYHNAIMAKAGLQKFLLNFFPHKEGNDFLYRLNLPKSSGSAANISRVLAKHGIKASTILNEYDGHAVMIATTGEEEAETKKAVQNAVEELGGEDGGGAELRVTRGRSEYVGENDRGRAGEVFGQLIEDREAIHPEWREIRSRLESRPGFVELGRLGRESLDLLESGQIKDPFTPASHGSRTPDIVEVDPRYHGKGPQGRVQDKRKLGWPEYWVNRSYFQIEGIPGEPFYERLPHQYKAIFNRENLYDFHGDPRQLHGQVPDKVLQYGGGGPTTYFEKLIKDAGYDGYYVSYGPQAGMVVAYNNTPVEAKLKAGEVQLPPRMDITKHFEGDNFSERRASIVGAGNAYDPDSLLTGDEVAKGMTYDNSYRDYPSQSEYDRIITGQVPTEEILRIAPRRFKPERQPQRMDLETLKAEAKRRRPGKNDALDRLKNKLRHFDINSNFGDRNTAALVAGDGSVAVGNFHVNIRGDIGYGEFSAKNWEEPFLMDGGVRVRARSGEVNIEFGKDDAETFERVRNVIDALPGNDFVLDYTPTGGGKKRVKRFSMGDRGSTLAKLDEWENGPAAPEYGSAAWWRMDLEKKPNLTWKDIKPHLLPDEREAYDGKPELQRKITEAVNMMPNKAEWDAAVKAGETGRLWYERSARAFDALLDTQPDMFDPGDKDKFLNFVAALSPVQPVRQNLVMAVNLWDKWNKAGRPQDVEWKDEKNLSGVKSKNATLYRILQGRGSSPGVDLPARMSNAIRALQGQPLSGPKVSAFAPNLGENAEKSTNDTWIAVFADVDPNTINKKHLYDAVSAQIRMAAKRNKISPRQAQSTIWSFIKALAELSGWGQDRWIPPQEILKQNLLTPELVSQHAADFADMLQNDPEIRAKLKKIGGNLDALDRELEARVPARPAAKGEIKELTSGLLGPAERLETARANARIQAHLERKRDQRGLFDDTSFDYGGPETIREPQRFDLETLKKEAAERRPKVE